jgi:hypothetical protein
MIMRKKQINSLGIYKSLAGASKPASRLVLSEEQLARLTRTAEVALAIVAVAGITTLAMIAPNVLQAIDKLFLKKVGSRLSHKIATRKTAQAFYYLKRSGLIQMRRSDSGWKIFLTNLGKEKIKAIKSEVKLIPKPKMWDRRWWLVAADIPTKDYRQGADLLRRKLKELGFYSLQRTLWLYPYDPRAEIQFLAGEYGISYFVTVMEVSRLDMEDEKRLKDHFQRLKIL